MKEVINVGPGCDFENLYISLRQKEGRLYSDEELMQLPFIARSHLHYKEWLTRRSALKKLIHYINTKGSDVDILEVGCGNGWLCAQLASITTGKVTGIDINNTELEQARRVFNRKKNLHFVNPQPDDTFFNEKKFDIILFAASIQYFRSLKEVFDIALNHLYANGEIHIIDSHFYKPSAVAAARQRTKDYYASMAFDDLANYYFHHSIEDLAGYRSQILQDPYSWKNKLTFNKNPFHWIVIKN